MRARAARIGVSGAIVAIAGLAACHTARVVPESGEIAAATAERVVRGTVAVPGTAFEMQIVLNTPNGVLRLFPSRQDSIALLRLEEVEIAARGIDTTGGMRLAAFTVVSVGGAPVADGFIRSDDAKLFLQTKDERLLIGHPPDVFKVLVGARVWIQGPLATGPYQYGVIVP